MLESLFNSEYCESYRSTYFEHLRKVVSENVFMELVKLKTVHTSISETSENVCFCFMVFSFGACIHMEYFFDVVKNKLLTVNMYLS